MSMLVSFVLSFFPRDVLDEILNLIGSVSEGFPSYSLRKLNSETLNTFNSCSQQYLNSTNSPVGSLCEIEI